MSEVNLTLTYDRHTGQIILSDGNELFCAAGFDVLRSRQLVLTTGEEPRWPAFLKALPELYETDDFQIDFHGPRTALEAFRETCADVGMTIDLSYESVPADSLHTVQYRAHRLVSLYEQINDYHFSCLNRSFFLEPLRKLVNTHLTEVPREDVLDYAEAVLEAGQLCLEDAQDTYRAAQLRQETRQNGDQFLNDRLGEIRRISFQMCPLTWQGMAFMNQETFLQPFYGDLQKLTDITTGAVGGEDTVSKLDSAALQMRYYMFFRTCEDVIRQKAEHFVEETNKKLQNLNIHTLWRQTGELKDYPLLDAFAACQIPWVPEIPAGTVAAEEKIACLHDYTCSLLQWIYGTYYDHFIKKWNAINHTNQQNVSYLSDQTQLIQDLLESSHRQDLQDRIQMDEERREIEEAEAFLEEVTILLDGWTDFGRN